MLLLLLCVFVIIEKKIICIYLLSKCTIIILCEILKIHKFLTVSKIDDWIFRADIIPHINLKWKMKEYLFNLVTVSENFLSWTLSSSHGSQWLRWLSSMSWKKICLCVFCINLGLMNLIVAVFYAWIDYLEQLSFLCKDYRTHWLQIHHPYFHFSKVQPGLQKIAVVTIILDV